MKNHVRRDSSAVKTKCIPDSSVINGLEVVCPLNQHNMQSLDFVVNRSVRVTSRPLWVRVAENSAAIYGIYLYT